MNGWKRILYICCCSSCTVIAEWVTAITEEPRWGLIKNEMMMPSEWGRRSTCTASPSPPFAINDCGGNRALNTSHLPPYPFHFPFSTHIPNDTIERGRRKTWNTFKLFIRCSGILWWHPQEDLIKLRLDTRRLCSLHRETIKNSLVNYKTKQLRSLFFCEELEQVLIVKRMWAETFMLSGKFRNQLVVV